MALLIVLTTMKTPALLLVVLLYLLRVCKKIQTAQLNAHQQAVAASLQGRQDANGSYLSRSLPDKAAVCLAMARATTIF